MIILSLLSLAVINVDSPRCQVLGESICLFIQDYVKLLSHHYSKSTSPTHLLKSTEENNEKTHTVVRSIRFRRLRNL